MDTTTLAVENRSSSGKGAARKIRAGNRAPGVVYGKGIEAFSITFQPTDLRGVLKSRLGKNSVISLTREGSAPVTVMLRELQLHPVSREVLHADFLCISETSEVNVFVPLKLTGRAEGVVAGGVLKQLRRGVNVKCLPKDIPVEVVMDVTPLKQFESLKVQDLTALAGCSFTDSLTLALATVE